MNHLENFDRRFHILLDGGHGSSGKGAVTTRIVDLLQIPNASGNNGPNAGHFVEWPRPGESPARLLFKAMPTAAALHVLPRMLRINPTFPTCWIGPNAGFEIEQLAKEVDLTRIPGEFLRIHGRAAITEQHHKDAEAPGGVMSTEHISSTMSGAGATYALKAMRQLSTHLAEEIPAHELGGHVYSAREFYDAVQNELAHDRPFLHEVAQGFPLSLDYGNHTRHGTYRNVSAQQAAADYGIRPEQVGNVYLNLRAYPIRVGNNYDADGKQVGYSGDWEPDQVELDWQTVGEAAGMPDEEIKRLYSSELTSVTKKLRRVASFSYEGTRYAARFNGANALVLNFTSYIDWASLGATNYDTISDKVKAFVDKLQDEIQLPVVMLGTGPSHHDYALPHGLRGLKHPGNLS